MTKPKNNFEPSVRVLLDNITNLITKTSEVHTNLQTDQLSIKKVKELHFKANQLQTLQEVEHLNGDETKEYVDTIRDAQDKLLSMAEKIKSERDPAFKNMNKKESIRTSSSRYLDLVNQFSHDCSSGFYDVMVEVETKYAENTKEFIESLQDQGKDVHIVQEGKEHAEENFNSNIVIVMPTSEYPNFQDNMQNMYFSNIREFFLLPYLTKVSSLEDIKEAVKDFDHSGEDYIDNVFREDLFLGTVRMYGSSKNPFEKLTNAVEHVINDIGTPILTNSQVHLASKQYLDNDSNEKLGLNGQAVSLEGQAKIQNEKNEKDIIESILEAKSKNIQTKTNTKTRKLK
jgi:hypothetical protein